ncbi:bifunctional hydroxymethylpyrimidine kinase/phosphomethylpyrimidine kinase [Natrialbaceae archaeon AArc-T1-2]|uniref:bifunctional hydroxymethylpyrimidine kinase/phosphomethylpyrimidine kinase n=1 Tax=Natrialbaceae archaeon AArc-T1-2 TaxID=3053904 RepID=UPI00255A7890|nr:bifunctional hydroxymethylpyrimidine kinase/phosphomethylpyrimidine kinase [Natrialbaceae archaeon AArc-T1-2]WIV68548.1 bifunctional hydroxymethylpyrimidine kinase/phosphomethylpyrimidine kinase [Natrialbaceae archaeon AArc-T1-2]
MRRPAPDDRPVGLTIAGSDSGGGAGIQADLATMTAGGVYGTSVVTAVTAQHTRGVESSHVLPSAEVRAQLEAVTDDFDVAAAKTGMLATTEIVETVAERALEFGFPLVVDPVMVATSGDRLLDPDAERAYEALIGEAAVVTPNADEVEVLTDIAVEDEASAIEAGEALRELGAEAALVKGGHVPGETVRDVLVTDDGTRTLEHPRVDTDATHGSGCTLAAAIVAGLARGEDLETAVEGATDLLARAIRYHYDVGRGQGAVNHAVSLRNDAARTETAEAVRSIVDRFVAADDFTSLVPAVGTDVVGATPYAETPAETAAVEGKLTRTPSGVAAPGGVRFGASSRVADVLLAARETDPALRFAASVRFDESLEETLSALEWAVIEAGDDAPVGSSAADSLENAPVAVVDRDDVGRVATTTLLATDAGTLVDGALELASRLE